MDDGWLVGWTAVAIENEIQWLGCRKEKTMDLAIRSCVIEQYAVPSIYKYQYLNRVSYIKYKDSCYIIVTT